MAAELEKQQGDNELEKQQGDNPNDDRHAAGTNAAAIAKAKSMRLRLIKARHENYLAERREERETGDDVTQELHLTYDH